MIFFSIFRSFSGQEVKYFSPENILRFANALYEQKEYRRAAVEYYRYLFSHETAQSEAARIYFKIGLCYQRLNDFDRSINAFQYVIKTKPESDLSWDASCQVAYGFFLTGRYEESISYAKDLFQNINSKERMIKWAQIIGINYIFQKKWEKAIEYIDSLEATIANNPLMIELKGYAGLGNRIQRRNPIFAGIMSAILPGTGKIYAGRTNDGIISFLTIALAGWQAYDGFSKHGIRSAKGWIYGSLGAFFYFGNIYGSISATKILNKQRESRFFEGINIKLRIYFE